MLLASARNLQAADVEPLLIDPAINRGRAEFFGKRCRRPPHASEWPHLDWPRCDGCCLPAADNTDPGAAGPRVRSC
jgi:hypothetical protein